MKPLPLILTVTFLIAMVMGPGPGLLLVNPDISQPDAQLMFAGIPRLYAWGLFWYAVQMTVVVIAYKTVWSDGSSDEEADHG